MLLLAPLRYGYYTLLRLVVTAAAAFLAYRQFDDQGVDGCIVALAGIAFYQSTDPNPLLT